MCWINPPFIGHLGLGTDGLAFVPLIPEVQPVGQVRSLGLGCLARLFQHFRASALPRIPFRPSQNIFGDGQTFLVIANDQPGPPSGRPFSGGRCRLPRFRVCHGAISSPK